ncbi:MAG: YggS family pyridoxal phosphate-dependent enzyme [Candidatus Zixiibacteriota bacterium]|nr:MAG: YggS family pyridoxal phosphate-dependent enzyme [candidate division Zixibacteria bacterium]
MMFEYIKENLELIIEKIAGAARRAGRSPEDITLVAVSKTHPAEAIEAAVKFGVTDIGESRIQEAEPKLETLGNIARWHMIGHLQTNKVKKAVAAFDIIQSVDSLKLATEIDRHAGQIGKKIKCLIEINSAGEVAKSGISLNNAMDLIQNTKDLENIQLKGIMTIGPLTDDGQLIRDAFRKTRKLFEQGRSLIGDQFDILSIGMSDDFEIAIEEGSNMVRIGTAIFGQRKI